MKKTKLALAISTAIFATSAMATNGDNMISTGANETAMGGAGVSGIHGAEGILTNPASTGSVTGTEFNIGGTVFMPSIKNSTTSFPTELTSDGDMYVIPAVSTATRINENWTFGLGMWGTSGLGVDYSNADAGGLLSTFDASSNLQLLKFAPSVTYNEDNFAVGFAPVLQYGSLDIHEDQSVFGGNVVGAGTSSDLGWGYTVGATYKTGDLTLGASYDSAIDMEYKDQITTQLNSFSGFGVTSFTNDHLEQPAQIKVGAAYQMDNITFAADFKQIKWGDAKGYKQFGWEDQNVFALGAKYSANDYWLAVGYNKGDTPVKEQNATTPDGAAKNFFNLGFFPATAEQHFTFGGGYSVSKNLSVDAAVAYSPETTKTFKTTAFGPTFGDVTTKHSELGYSVQMSYKF
ncbi:OmpP1/FadL family transporter [Thiomicrorhabdus sp.]|uniref:OmpP1/FadL family transporter n=1 Tax=Thiomicrorhabdus sp. TaxID=2039724 RepID=UPI002AA5E4B2|nr:porin [Thiomicrorhabdus sp.]